MSFFAALPRTWYSTKLTTRPTASTRMPIRASTSGKSAAPMAESASVTANPTIPPSAVAASRGRRPPGEQGWRRHLVHYAGKPRREVSAEPAPACSQKITAKFKKDFNRARKLK